MCQTSPSEDAEEWLTYLRTITSDPVVDPQSRELLALPRLEADAVHLVREDAICARAGAALRRADAAWPGSGRLWVFAVGDRYVVIDAANQVGEWVVGYTFDARFERLLAERVGL